MNEAVIERKVTGLNLKKAAYLAFKRAFDFTVGLFGMLILLPVALIIKIAYVLSKDYSKIVYTQTRIGKNGVPFKMYKFRSMVPNAGEVLEEMLKDPKYKEEWDKYQKFENDPRITKVGKIIRKGSIDELPQFINLLQGNISLIGPRPLVKGELEMHGGETKYNNVKPGITGWWAVNGRSNLDYEERLALEYYYVENQSLMLDIKIFFKTISVVINSKGAK